ncbi:MAG: OmpA family protein [Bacteroidetes bacterium]|nr:hypothetical protein [Bacteroidota bacterium]MBV6461788.1 hypothetical protein [Flavobacteriales bacterium]WKZ75902.1 MAG: OmpA family protein [Vicingaceae bacterium]MCL4816719.1 OmpA family protein [Flavobacteriales bacterium]NOG95579.1 OmpA family protein [Bacteroidota bacterium]
MIRSRAGIFFSFLLLFSSLLFSQSRRELIHLGDAAFKNENFASAAHFYRLVVERNTSENTQNTFPYEIRYWKGNGKQKTTDTTSVKSEEDKNEKKTEISLEDHYVYHQIAESYRRNSDYKNAEIWYEKIKHLKSEQFPAERVWYADCLMKNGKYDHAIEQIELFREDTSSSITPELSLIAEKLMMGCYFANDPESDNPNMRANLLDSLINSGTASYSINYFGDERKIIFSSARQGNVTGENELNNPSFLSDFYLGEFNDGKLEYVTNMGSPINSENIEGAGVLSPDRSTFYFTRKSNLNSSECAIYVSKFFNNQWLQPMKLDNKVNAEGFKSMHPTLSEKGDILFYSSNRPGGQGGMDIWYCTIDEYGSMEGPYNLGFVVNSPRDEVSPFYHHNTKVLFFSSNGHIGIGGFDVFQTQFNEDDETWAMPKNAGRPINSSKDDAFFVMNKELSGGYFSSDRDVCKDCGEDYKGSEYCYKVYSFGKAQMEFSVSGVVYNAETDEVIPNALITFKDVKGNFEPFFITTDEEGAYYQELQHNWQIFIKAQKVKFFGDAATVSTMGLTESQHIIQDFYLTPIPAGEIEIPGIEYDYDKATLRPESKKILDDLIEFLKLNDNLTIEIRSHTDQRGNDDYNLRLSKERAKSVVDYLMANGIEKDRLFPIGLGETELLDDCFKDHPECGETGKTDCDCHQRNRRTAFKPISQDYNNIFKGK